jgi:RNA polymerase sigma-70 factor, ECF subfamily
MSIATILAKIVAEDKLSDGPSTLPQLTPAVYADLRRLARTFMRSERPGHTLQPTAVVNEAFLRLMRADIKPNDAPHFFRIAAETMRRVLVDHAKGKCRDKRDTPSVEEMQTITQDTWTTFDETTPLDVLDIDRALNALADKAPRAAEFLELRYFAGLEDPEISVICGVSEATVTREIRFARAYLAKLSKTNKEPI